MIHLELFKKFKRISPLEPSLGILGFLFVTLFFLGVFLYLDYGASSRSFRFSSLPSRTLYRRVKRTSSLPDFLEMGGDGCDVFDGNWVWDDGYPLYQSRECGFLDQGFRCSENGRPDSLFTKWRWQPKECRLPRFDAKRMLEILRNRRLVFVGDSIGRNQWESMLCLLSSAVSDKSSIFEVNGSPITKHTGFLVFKFKDFNCTVEYYRAPFLVPQGRKPAGAPDVVKTTLKLDRMDWSSKLWKDADVIVLNTGHWWNNEKTIRGGCYFQEGETVMMEMSVENAYRRAIETVMDWVDSQINFTNTQVFFRTYAPVHFSGGDWRNGGSCHLETLPDLSSTRSSFQMGMHFSNFMEALSRRTLMMKLNLLNVTFMSLLRKDAHSSLYYMGPEAGPSPLHRQDCSHWCLPGVPDSWNELLYALFLKRQYTHISNITSVEFHSQENS